MTNGVNRVTLLHVDIGDLRSLVDQLTGVLTPEQGRTIIGRVLRRAATKTKKLVREEIKRDYHAKAGWVSASIGSARITDGASPSCIIPVNGVRGRIGKGLQYTASAMGTSGKRITSLYTGRPKKPGSKQKGRTRRDYAVSAQIVKAGTSSLPTSGDRIHIMTLGRTGTSGKVFVIKNGPKVRMTERRRTKTMGVRTYSALKKPITSAVGIAVPQMPMTRSAPAIQTQIRDLIQDRVAHEYWQLLTSVRRG